MTFEARRVTAGAGWVLALAGAAFAMSASAEVYKWTDERGVVNYTSTPPKSRTAQKLDVVEDNRLTVVPTSREELERAAITAQQLGRDRVQRENATERSRIAAQAQSQPSARGEVLRAWRERCINEKWADCDDERALFARYNTDPRYGGGYAYRYAPGVAFPGQALAGRPVTTPTPPGPGSTPPQPYAPMARIGSPQPSAPAASSAPRAGTIRGNASNGTR